MKRRQAYTYSLLDVLAASGHAPMAAHKRMHQVTKMYQGLHAIERGQDPEAEDWRVLADAVNLTETLVEMGELQDPSCLLIDAVQALSEAARRWRTLGALRLNARGVAAVRAVLEDYTAALEQLSERTIILAHRATEKRLRQVLQGKTRPGDVVEAL